ncbi:MAG TPA: ribosome maturation factor RimM [Bryobacteraceae bacterium]|nr:ribosome maturation factor RimM [Bryobacteraceae bacterium]
MNKIAVAVIVRPRGNRGELTAVSLSSRPERFAALRTVDLNGELREVERVWDHDGALIFKFRGIDSISDAERLRGVEVCIPESERIQLEPGEYFHSDLIGCEVRDFSTDRLIGHVTGWEEYGGPALLEVDGGRLLIPFVKAICKDIRPADRLVRVELPEGLEE